MSKSENEIKDDPVLKKLNIVLIGIFSPILITVSILYGLGII